MRCACAYAVLASRRRRRWCIRRRRAGYTDEVYVVPRRCRALLTKFRSLHGRAAPSPATTGGLRRPPPGPVPRSRSFSLCTT